jgi:hypothetical protein
VRTGKEPNMKIWISLTLVALVVAALGIWAVANRDDVESVATTEEPAVVEHIEGSELSLVTLSERAAERLDIRTEEARDERIGGQTRRVIPYAAVLYDAEGETWVYTSPEPLQFVRAPIAVERIDGDLAILTDGPEAGTAVVTVGGAMLFGAEFGVGH